MAVYKIFPDKDATIYSLFPNMNTGLDEMIESTLTTFAYSQPNPQASRFLISFDGPQIDSILENKMGVSSSAQLSGSGVQVNLRCFIATATGLEISPTGTAVDVFYPSVNWSMGTGKYLDDPISTDGTSWYWSTYSGSTAWATSGFPATPGITASYTGSSNDRNINPYAGGGTWYYSSSLANAWNSDFYPITGSQTFTYSTDKDINIDVTNIIGAWSAGALADGDGTQFYGFIVKQNPEFVNNKDYQPELKYFSVDTNTIYPPCLEFKWNDWSYNTGSLSVINTTPATLSLNENPGVFFSQSVNIFRVNAGLKYPPRTWVTSSWYTTNYALPTASYYAVKDLDTNEFVIDFDTTYTKISCDATGSFFTLYMDGLEPERYYKILIQTNINGNTIVYDDNYYFKILNG